MNENIQNLFAKEERMNERKFHSLEGDWNTEDFYTDGQNPAASNTPIPQKAYQTSSPYVIRVTNTNAAVDETNVVILQAYARIQFAQTLGDHFGNSNNIRIFSSLANTTYVQFLYDIMNNPAVVGLTIVSALTAAQVQQPLSITTQNARGQVNTVPFVSPIVPNQFQTTVLSFRNVYKVDGFTSITISTLAHAETMTFWFYPSNILNIANALANEGITEPFDKPNLLNQQQVTLSIPKGY